MLTTNSVSMDWKLAAMFFQITAKTVSGCIQANWGTLNNIPSDFMISKGPAQANKLIANIVSIMYWKLAEILISMCIICVSGCT